MGLAFSDFTFSLCLRRIQTSPRRLKRAVIEQLQAPRTIQVSISGKRCRTVEVSRVKRSESESSISDLQFRYAVADCNPLARTGGLAVQTIRHLMVEGFSRDV